MKRILPGTVLRIIVMIVLAASIIFAAGCSKTAASVNGIPVEQDEVETYMNVLLAQNPEADATLTDEERKDLEIDIIDSLLIAKLLEQYAADNDIAASQEEIDKQIGVIAESYESESEFESELKSKGVDRQFLEYEIRNQILGNKIYLKTIAGVTVTEEQLKEYYQENSETMFTTPAQVKVSHILSIFPWIEDQKIEENDQDKEKVRDKIESVAEQLKNGAEFGDMAREYSDDTGTSVKDGDLGFITRGQMVEEFETAAFSLDIGEVSDIIETKFGYHIIKMFDEKEEEIQEFEEVKEAIATQLVESYKFEKWDEFLAKLIADADIQYFSENEGTLNDANDENE